MLTKQEEEWMEEVMEAMVDDKYTIEMWDAIMTKDFEALEEMMYGGVREVYRDAI